MSAWLDILKTELFFLGHFGTLFLNARFGQCNFFLILGFFDRGFVTGFVGQINVPKKCNGISKKNSILNWNDAEIN